MMIVYVLSDPNYSDIVLTHRLDAVEAARKIAMVRGENLRVSEWDTEKSPVLTIQVRDAQEEVAAPSNPEGYTA